MSDSPNHAENGNGAADSKLGRVNVLPYRGGSPRGGVMPRGLRLWARKNLSRKQLLTSLRTLLWVVPLTLLIWIYAEREQQFAPPPVTIPIEVTTNDPNRVVILKRPQDSLVMASIKGPRTGVEAVMHSWDPNFGGGPVRIEIERNLGTGDNRIDASVAIGNDPRFATHGVSLSSCQPAWLDVFVDQIVDKAVEIKAVNVPSNVASVTFSPPTVKVRVPQKALDEAGDSLHAEADLAHQPELSAAAPTEHTIELKNVLLTLPIKDRNVSIVGSPVVQAEVVLAEDQEKTLSLVPVEVVTTKELMDGYRFEFDPALRDVTVVGPRAQIELLSASNPDSAKYRKATFEVTRNDISSLKETGSKTVPVDFNFPPGVHYKSGPSTIKFDWVRRNAE